MAHPQAQADFRSNTIRAQGGVYFNTTSNNTHTHIHSPPPAANSYVNPQLLIKACRDGNFHLAQGLLNQMHPGDVNYADITDDNNTALHLAAKSNNIALVKLLLGDRLIDVNATNKRIETPLYVAAELGHSSIVALLLRAPGININLRTKDERRHIENTALHAAASGGHTVVVQLLLRQANIDVNVRDNLGRTPLLLAAREGRSQIVYELLAHPYIDVNAVDMVTRQKFSARLRLKAERTSQGNGAKTTPLCITEKRGIGHGCQPVDELTQSRPAVPQK